MDKLLSVIVPSYNMEKYLPKCLGSLIVDEKIGRENRSTAEGSYLDLLDVIVVNDGSTDRTSEIAHEFEKKYPGVFRVIDKPNGNYGSCINAALPVAAGRFVKILDADDTYDTDALGQYLVALSQMPDDIDMVMNDYEQVDEVQTVAEIFHYALPVDVTFRIDRISTPSCYMSMHAVAYRTRHLLEIGYKQTEGISYTDTEWFYLPVAFARNVRYVPLALYKYLVGRAGQTVDVPVWIKNRAMLNRVLARLFEGYYANHARSSIVSREYMERQIQRLVTAILPIYLSFVTCAEARQWFGMLKRAVSTHSFVEDVLKRYMMFGRTPFRFYYAVLCYRHPSVTYVVLPFVRLYSAMRARLCLHRNC